MKHSFRYLSGLPVAILVFTIAAILTLTACSTQGSQSGYTVNGTAKGTVDGDTMLLCEAQGVLSIIPLDTAVIKNDKFQFTGEQEGAVLRLLMPLNHGNRFLILQNDLQKDTYFP